MATSTEGCGEERRGLARTGEGCWDCWRSARDSRCGRFDGRRRGALASRIEDWRAHRVGTEGGLGGPAQRQSACPFLARPPEAAHFSTPISICICCCCLSVTIASAANTAVRQHDDRRNRVHSLLIQRCPSAPPHAADTAAAPGVAALPLAPPISCRPTGGCALASPGHNARSHSNSACFPAAPAPSTIQPPPSFDRTSRPHHTTGPSHACCARVFVAVCSRDSSCARC